MASEKYVTIARSTLNSSYTSGGTSLVLASGSDFPSSGNFRVIVIDPTNGDEIFKCTSRSGATLTVVGAQEGTSAANHASGLEIRAVITASAWDAIRQDQCQFGTFANLPASGERKSGDQYLQTDGAYNWAFNGSIWVPRYRGMNCVQPTLNTWYNQGSSTIDSSKGPYVLTVPSAGGASFTGYIVSVTEPFTVIALTQVLKRAVTNYIAAGLCLFRPANNQFVGLCHDFGADRIGVLTGTATSNYSFSDPYFKSENPIWTKIELTNGTDIKYSLSIDGFNWIQLKTHTKTTSFTTGPTHVGIGCGADVSSPGYDSQIICYSLSIV